MLQLYSYYRSSAAYRVRIALALKGLAFESIPVNLLEQENYRQSYLDKNPQGLVPALDIGGQILNQSLAIMEYLEEVNPKPALLPADPIERAQIRSLAYEVAIDIHPINNLRIINFLTSEWQHSESNKFEWLHHWMTTGFAAIENRLQQGSQGQFCFGDTVTLADICLIPQVYNAHRFECPMDDFPLINAIVSHCNTLDAFKRAAPEAQPDSP
ncbi:maleylacetoacetate isomerase [Oceanicoccus sagamiensis]|uniref:Maleylacetoacetate isomerase n=1 Tax=Oceanicoccus sagamiensis TaxID=716816 RepID=A0A1X9NFQ8_9GAMM|nr:maleylacetoacetate isomerase [Oceanicoccus sagamiensis]ARN75252.1 maleylacetoacetate isomerase [Oceanicoccus sagamiensis]